jgi:glycosyltransferase involved in cell wall biosynthesis
MKILFVCNTLASWVKKDLDDLKQKYDVKLLYHKSFIGNLFLTIKYIWKVDLIFSWFAGRHLFIPLIFARILNKPVVCVVGGYDTASLPEIQYGNLRPGIKRMITLWLLKNITYILPVSKYAKDEVLKNTSLKLKNIHVVTHGFDDVTLQSLKKEKIILTVGKIDKGNFVRKGINKFVELSKNLPDFEFYAVGELVENELKNVLKNKPSNLHFTGRLSDEELNKMFSRATVYVQLSAHEAFGSAVAEAMLYKCIPVVSDRGALPEVVGDSGFVVPYDNFDAAKDSIKKAFENLHLGSLSRERIITQFPREKRKKLLYEIISAFEKKS